MKRKIIITLAFLLLMAAAAFPAFAAENVQLQVNGDIVPSSNLQLVNGVSMISVETYTRFAGADVQETPANNFTITENGNTLNLTLGNKEAMLGDTPIELPVEPTKMGDTVLIPLRAVSNAFGFEVGWNGEQLLVTLTRSETRDGMTSSDLLVKSTMAGQAYNTYSMDGLFNIAMDITEDGKAVEQAPKNVTSKLTGQIQNKPFAVYMKQALTPGESIPEMVVETYMTEEKMYIKAPVQEWTSQTMPFTPEFLKQQQDIQSDPMKAAALMKEMGMLLNFGNDLTVNGKDYYVVNASLDMEKFKQGYGKLLQQAMQGTSQGAASGSPEEIQKQLQKFLDSAQLDYNYSALINKATLISDIIKFDARLKMSMESPAPAQAEGEQKESAPKQIKMDMVIDGDINIVDPGGPFNAPDVSAAKEMTMRPSPQN